MRLTRAAALSLFALVLSAPPIHAQDGPSRSLKEAIGDSLLRTLYVATPIAHAADGWSTLKVLDLGGKELNPLLAKSAENRAVFVATKSAFVAGELWVVHKIAKDHKFGAIAAMVGLNVAYAMLTAHNLRVADFMRQQQARQPAAR